MLTVWHIVFVFQSLSCIQLFATPWTVACQAWLSFAISQSLLRSTSFESMMLPHHLNLYCTLLLLHSILLSIRVFSNDSTYHIRWPKYWSFSISPSSEYSGLISFKTDWFDLLFEFYFFFFYCGSGIKFIWWEWWGKYIKTLQLENKTKPFPVCMLFAPQHSPAVASFSAETL